MSKNQENYLPPSGEPAQYYLRIRIVETGMITLPRMIWRGRLTLGTGCDD
jgi:hypothetical protein